MKDINSVIIKPGQTIVRTVEYKNAPQGKKYEVIERKWNEDDIETSLVASGSFISELLTPINSSEFRIVSTPQQ